MTAHAPLVLPPPRSGFAGLRQALLLGCAIAGLSVAAPNGQVDAQAFNATPKTVFGGVVYDRATPGVETVTVDTPTAIINWTPLDPLLAFLPAGNTATFVNGPSVLDYAVLNRILTMEPVRFDGTVLGLIGDLAAGTAAPGGTILFSSPGGIIIGATAVFDVGNLVLTSLNVVDDGAGNFISPNGTILMDGGAGAPNAAIVTEPGAQINALAQGSYVAMVAPRILHGGAVRVNGSAAYVAGEQVQLTVNQGLFDIIVQVGSDNATPIVHTGSTGGPASTDVNDVHRIYMVAVPKNQAITAILQGDVGFDPAVNAAVENGAIVLSAGFNVANGEADRFGDFTPPPIKGIDASFHIRGGTVTSDLSGYAVTDMLASGQTTGTLNFQQDVSLFGGVRAHLFAGAGQNVVVGGNVLVSAARTRSADPNIIDLTGGEALIFAQGGNLNILGNATVDASGQGTVNVVTSIAGSGTGGTAGVFAEQGMVQINGHLSVLATGTGGTLDLNPNQGGAGTGGDALLEGRNGGGVIVGGSLAMDASGTASRAGGQVSVTGAVGTGGDVRVGTTGGSVSVAGPATLTAEGRGGNVLAGAGNVGGAGQGGNILINVGVGIVTFAGTSTITMSTGGFGGLGPNGGAAQGGNIFLDARDGQIVLGGAAGMNASGTGGDAAFEPGGTGGAGTGGEVRIVAHSGPTPSQIRGAALAVSVQGTGGTGGTGLAPMPAGRGGDGTGGSVSLLAESGNGALQFGGVTAFANGTGGNGGVADTDGDGGRGGDGAGGDVQAGTVAGPAFPTPLGSARFASLDLRASGLGGPGGSGSGIGGNAAGGLVGLLATGALTSVQGSVALQADATGGAGGDSVLAGGAPGALGQAEGGQLIVAAMGGPLSAGNVTGSAVANGAGGTADTPGEWHVSAGGGGTVNFTNLNLTAGATGMPATLPFSSLEAMGGVITVTQTAALATPAEIRVMADGTGRITGGLLDLDAGRDVIVTHTNIGTGITIDVTDLDIDGENVTVAAGSFTRASNRTDIAARANMAVGGRMEGREIRITSAGADIAATGIVGAATTELTDIRATGNASIAGQVLGGTILVASATLNVAGTATIGSGTTAHVGLDTSGVSMIAGRVLGRDILVDAANVTVTPTGAVGDGATFETQIRAVNTTIAGTVLGRTVIVLGNAALTVAPTGTVGGVGTEGVSLTSLGTAGIAGRVLGRSIQISSADIDIATTGAVGDAGSELVTLAAGNTGQVLLGGTAQGPGYTLTGAEAGRIRAGILRVLAQLGANPLVVVRDLTLAGGGAAAGIGTLEVVTPGIVRVEGALTMTNAAANNGISINAGTRLEIVTPAGGVRVRDGGGNPGGTLTLTSNNIWIAAQGIIDQLRIDPNYAGRDDDLIDNGGVEDPRGHVEAGGVTLATGGTLFVQNSGPPFSPAFAGVTVGAGGLVIRSAGPGPAVVTAFGRRLNPDGSFTVGPAFFRDVTYQTAGVPLAAGYSAGSTLNTCIIVTGQCGQGPVNPGPGGPEPITGPTGGSEAIPLPQQGGEGDDLVDTSFSTEVLIEEPVTSGGESGLWDCDDDNDGDCDDQHD